MRHSVASALVGFALLLASCERERVARYQTRGLVRGWEGLAEDTRIAIQHESIDKFEDRDGKTAPMRSMTMIFGLAPALRGHPIASNTKVKFEFEVRWDSAPFLTVQRLDVLPPQTALSLSDRHAQH